MFGGNCVIAFRSLVLTKDCTGGSRHYSTLDQFIRLPMNFLSLSCEVVALLLLGSTCESIVWHTNYNRVWIIWQFVCAFLKNYGIIIGNAVILFGKCENCEPF